MPFQLVLGFTTENFKFQIFSSKSRDPVMLETRQLSLLAEMSLLISFSISDLN